MKSKMARIKTEREEERWKEERTIFPQEPMQIPFGNYNL